MRILTHLQALDEALGAWKRYQEIPYDRFVSDRDVQYMVFHAMLIALQSSIDTATAFAVMKTSKRPDTYRETFQVLGRQGLIPEGLARELSALAAFRNLLVHEYAGLDVDRVYRILMDHYQTLDAFRVCIRDYIRDSVQESAE